MSRPEGNTNMDRSALQFAMQSGVSVSKIFLYTAESLPLVLARRALGIGNRPDPGLSRNHRKILLSEILNMLKDDFRNISNKLYFPESLASSSPIEHAKRYIWLVKDSVNATKRAKNRQYMEFSRKAKMYLPGLPEYYRRNFHYQTDGYLSEESAELYEHQTEILFMGTLGLMRRLLLADLIAIGRKKADRFRVLEIGCGTGESTEILARSLPHIYIEAIDLSDPYLAKARQRLDGVSNARFIQADGMRFRSNKRFDAVVSSYCLHEMPTEIRKQVIENSAANLRKGGYLLLIDSLQLGERREFDWALKEFPKDFHEPFYANYIQTPLRTLLSKNLAVVDEKSRFLSKSLLASKT